MLIHCIISWMIAFSNIFWKNVDVWIQLHLIQFPSIINFSNICLLVHQESHTLDLRPCTYWPNSKQLGHRWILLPHWKLLLYSETCKMWFEDPNLQDRTTFFKTFWVPGPHFEIPGPNSDYVYQFLVLVEINNHHYCVHRSMGPFWCGTKISVTFGLFTQWNADGISASVNPLEVVDTMCHRPLQKVPL